MFSEMSKGVDSSICIRDLMWHDANDWKIKKKKKNPKGKTSDNMVFKWSIVLR